MKTSVSIVVLSISISLLGVSICLLNVTIWQICHRIDQLSEILQIHLEGQHAHR